MKYSKILIIIFLIFKGKTMFKRKLNNGVVPQVMNETNNSKMSAIDEKEEDNKDDKYVGSGTWSPHYNEFDEDTKERFKKLKKEKKLKEEKERKDFERLEKNGYFRTFKKKPF